MTCEFIKTDDGVMIVCGRGRRAPTKRCSACNHYLASLECDFPTPTHKSGTCDRALCSNCAVHISGNRDHCPHHPPPDQQGSLF